MATELDRIDEQLRLSFEGGAWHGPAVLQVLDGIAAEAACAHPIGTAHSVWEVVLHLGGTYGLVLRRLEGDARPLTPEEDWPVVVSATADSWRETVRALHGLNEELRRAVRGLSAERLDGHWWLRLRTRRTPSSLGSRSMTSITLARSRFSSGRWACDTTLGRSLAWGGLHALTRKVLRKARDIAVERARGRELGVEGRGDHAPLADQHRLAGVAAEHLDVGEERAEARGADEDGLDAARRAPAPRRAPRTSRPGGRRRCARSTRRAGRGSAGAGAPRARAGSRRRRCRPGRRPRAWKARSASNHGSSRIRLRSVVLSPPGSTRPVEAGELARRGAPRAPRRPTSRKAAAWAAKSPCSASTPNAPAITSPASRAARPRGSARSRGRASPRRGRARPRPRPRRPASAWWRARSPSRASRDPST